MILVTGSTGKVGKELVRKLQEVEANFRVGAPNRHATKHFHKTKHPIIRSFEPGEYWKWCYVDEREV